MTLFRYQAVTPANEVLEGDIEALDQAAVVEKLRDLGQIPLQIEERTVAASDAWWNREVFRRAPLSGKDVALFCRGLATLVHAGLPLDQSLDLQIKLARVPRKRDVLIDIRDRVHGGASLADALAAHPQIFPPFLVNMVRAGEAGGALEAVLDRLAAFLERALELRAQIVSALIYPAILMVMVGVSLALLLTVVVPQFRPLFDGAGQELPVLTRIVIGVAEFLQAYWWAVVAALVLLFAAIKVSLRDSDRRVRWDRVMLRLPLLGDLISKVQVAVFSRLLGTLLANGVPLVAGLELVRDSLRNQALSRAVDQVISEVKEGGGVAQSLMNMEVFPALGVDLIRIGEESGQLEQMLGRVADIYDTEVGRSLERLIVILVPVITIGLGVLIATIIASILFAMLGVNRLAF